MAKPPFRSGSFLGSSFFSFPHLLHPTLQFLNSQVNDTTDQHDDNSLEARGHYYTVVDPRGKLRKF